MTVDDSRSRSELRYRRTGMPRQRLGVTVGLVAGWALIGSAPWWQGSAGWLVVVFDLAWTLFCGLLARRRLTMGTTVTADFVVTRGWLTHAVPVAAITELIAPGRPRPAIWLTRDDRATFALPGTSAADLDDITHLTGVPARPRTPRDP